jgi:hypothetical protein
MHDISWRSSAAGERLFGLEKEEAGELQVCGVFQYLSLTLSVPEVQIKVLGPRYGVVQELD